MVVDWNDLDDHRVRYDYKLALAYESLILYLVKYAILLLTVRLNDLSACTWTI